MKVCARCHPVERWRPAKGLGYGKYLVSNRGNVRLKKKETPRKQSLMKGSKCAYPGISIRVPGLDTPRSIATHRIVASVWIQKPEDYDRNSYHVDHIDDDATHACARNLQWLPGRDNLLKRHGSCCDGEGCTICRAEEVYCDGCGGFEGCDRCCEPILVTEGGEDEA